MAQSPCLLLPLSFTPLTNSLLLQSHFSFTYLETLLDVIGSRPPWPQVTCKLTSPFPSPPHSKFPTPRGYPELNMRLTKTTSRFRLQGPEQILLKRLPCLFFNLFIYRSFCIRIYLGFFSFNKFAARFSRH